MQKLHKPEAAVKLLSKNETHKTRGNYENDQNKENSIMSHDHKGSEGDGGTKQFGESKAIDPALSHPYSFSHKTFRKSYHFLPLHILIHRDIIQRTQHKFLNRIRAREGSVNE